MKYYINCPQCNKLLSNDSPSLNCKTHDCFFKTLVVSDNLITFLNFTISINLTHFQIISSGTITKIFLGSESKNHSPIYEESFPIINTKNLNSYYSHLKSICIKFQSYELLY